MNEPNGDETLVVSYETWGVATCCPVDTRTQSKTNKLSSVCTQEAGASREAGDGARAEPRIAAASKLQGGPSDEKIEVVQLPRETRISLS